MEQSMEKQLTYLHTDTETVRFETEFKLRMFSAFKKAGLRRADWEDMESIILEKYAQGEFEKDQKLKPASYIFSSARNCAFDECRKQRRFVELDDMSMAGTRDSHNFFAMMERNDQRVVVEEAFRRLVKECRDRQKVQILLRYVVNGESRDSLAQEFEVTQDFISLVKNRLLPRLQQLVRQIYAEDLEGRLQFSNTDIGFLTPFMVKW